MANTIRIKKRAGTGNAGAPTTLAPSELAFNENSSDRKLYYGLGDDGDGTSSSVIAIGGDGAFTTLDTAQTISGNKTFTGTCDFSGATLSGNTTFSNNLTISGDLTVQGQTITIDSTTIDVADKNITLGNVATPTDSTANLGGITLKGATDKTFNWVNSTDSWTASEHIDLASGKEFKINNTSVLSGSTLGSGVTSSSLTSVGTITTGTWNGTAIGIAYGGTGLTAAPANGQLAIGNGTGYTLSTLTAGSNITITEASGSITIAAAAGAPTAGDGIDVSGSEVSVDLKANGGLVIETTELAVDLAASSITGTLPVSKLTSVTSTAAELNIVDGSTSATSTTLAAADRMVINDNGTMVQVALSDLVTFLENGTASSFELDGGTF